VVCECSECTMTCCCLSVAPLRWSPLGPRTCKCWMQPYILKYLLDFISPGVLSLASSMGPEIGRHVRLLGCSVQIINPDIAKQSKKHHRVRWERRCMAYNDPHLTAPSRSLMYNRSDIPQFLERVLQYLPNRALLVRVIVLHQTPTLPRLTSRKFLRLAVQS
jgi:hypothetical protein